MMEPQATAHSDAVEGTVAIAFACHGCGDCCKGTTILLSPFDLARLSARTGEEPVAILKERCVVLKHPQTNLPAVMLETIPQCSLLDDQNRCTVYPDRPLVCRGYPLGVRMDLNEPGWRDPLRRFALRPNPCPPPRTADFPLPMVQTLHSMATASGMEPYAEAYRAWARLTWDTAVTWRYAQMPLGESMVFDREFVKLLFEEVDTPVDEGAALTSFLRRVAAFRARYGIPTAGEAAVNSLRGAPSA